MSADLGAFLTVQGKLYIRSDSKIFRCVPPAGERRATRRTAGPARLTRHLSPLPSPLAPHPTCARLAILCASARSSSRRPRPSRARRCRRSTLTSTLISPGNLTSHHLDRTLSAPACVFHTCSLPAPSSTTPTPTPRRRRAQLRDLEGGVALPAAQEPAQDRVDDRLPPRQQEGRLGGGGQEALAQDGQAPARRRRRRRVGHPCQAQPAAGGPRCSAVRRSSSLSRECSVAAQERELTLSLPVPLAPNLSPSPSSPAPRRPLPPRSRARPPAPTAPRPSPRPRTRRRSASRSASRSARRTSPSPTPSPRAARSAVAPAKRASLPPSLLPTSPGCSRDGTRRCDCCGYAGASCASRVGE